MGNEVAAQAGVKGGLTLALPAHLQAAMQAAGGGNIKEGFAVNQLTFPGKVWTLNVGGDKKILTRTIDGEVENMQILKAVILDQGLRGRNFYEGIYDNEHPRAPDCWSADGQRPHSSIQSPQSSTCASCAMSAKGSHPGGEGVACRGFKYLALLLVNPAGSVMHQMPALRLKLPPTSIWDERDEEATASGWYAWDNFAKMLRANKCAYTNAMTVRMRFANTEHPKIQFAAGEYLSTEDFDLTLKRAQDDEVKQLVTYNPPAPRAQDGDGDSDKLARAKAAEAAGGDPVFGKSGYAAEQAQRRESERNAKIAEAEKADRLRAEQEAEEKAATAQRARELLAAKDEEDMRLQAAAEVQMRARIEAQVRAEMEARLAAASPSPPPSVPDTPPPPSSAIDAGWDEPASNATASVQVSSPETPAPTKNTVAKATPTAPASAPAEVPPSLSGILGEWE